MRSPFLLIVSGLPCAGKTTIAEKLAFDLKLPLFTKDSIKELLFDALGWKDRDWSRQLSHASVELLLHFSETQLRSGHSLIIESNFQPDLAVSRLRWMQAQYQAVFCQVYCRANPETLYDRFKARTGTRHPGHVDEQYLDEFSAVLSAAPQEALDLSCPVIEVDTTDYGKLDYVSLLKAVQDVQGAPQANG